MVWEQGFARYYRFTASGFYNEITDLVTGGQGDTGRARFSWTLSGIEHARPGVATVILERAGERWQVVSIQNTAKGHAMRAASPAPGATPSPAGHKH